MSPHADGTNTAEETLFSWLEDQLSGDEETRASTLRALGEFLVFYVLIGIGFAALWLTWRSNSQIRQFKAAAAAVVREQRSKKFEPPDNAPMYGMF